MDRAEGRETVSGPADGCGKSSWRHRGKLIKIGKDPVFTETLAIETAPQIGPALVNGQIAQLIEKEKGTTNIGFERFTQRAVDLGRREMIDHIDRSRMANRVAMLTGRVTQRA